MSLMIVFLFLSLPLLSFLSIAWHELGHGLLYWFETKEKPCFFWVGGDVVLVLDTLDVYARNRVLAGGLVLGLLVGLFGSWLLWGWSDGFHFLINVLFVFTYAWGSMHDVVEVVKNSKEIKKGNI